MKAILNIWTTKKKVVLFKTFIINVLSLNYKRKLHGTPVFMNSSTHLKTVLVVLFIFLLFVCLSGFAFLALIQINLSSHIKCVFRRTMKLKRKLPHIEWAQPL